MHVLIILDALLFEVQIKLEAEAWDAGRRQWMDANISNKIDGWTKTPPILLNSNLTFDYLTRQTAHIGT